MPPFGRKRKKIAVIWFTVGRAACRACSESVLAPPDLGENLGIRQILQPQPRLEIRVRARRNGFVARSRSSRAGTVGTPFCAHRRDLRRPCLQRRILPVHRQREAGVARRVLVARIDQRRRPAAPPSGSRLAHICSGVPSNSRPQPITIRLSAEKSAPSPRRSSRRHARPCAPARRAPRHALAQRHRVARRHRHVEPRQPRAGPPRRPPPSRRTPRSASTACDVVGVVVGDQDEVELPAPLRPAPPRSAPPPARPRAPPCRLAASRSR